MNNYAETIKERVHTRDLCQRLGIGLDRNGYAVCPFHADGNASMKVYADPARGFHCFACGVGGSVIDFAMRWYGITFRQAIARLDCDFGLGLPLTHTASPQERKAARMAAEAAARERAARARAREEAETEYWLAYRLWQMLDRLVWEGRPKGPEDEISQSYAEALKRLPEVRDWLERAEDEMREAAGGGGRRADLSARGRYRQMDENGLSERRRAV